MSDPRVTAHGVQCREERFAEIYRGNYRQVRDYCRRRVGVDLVDDVVAETFLTAWRRLEDVPDGVRARVWLYGVAHRVVGHQWRSAARRRRLEHRLRSIATRSVSSSADPVDDVAGTQLVLDAAGRLGATDAEVLRLAMWEQLSVGDIASVLDIAPNAVKQRLHRARRNLAREYRRLTRRSSPEVETGDAR